MPKTPIQWHPSGIDGAYAVRNGIVLCRIARITQEGKRREMYRVIPTLPLPAGRKFTGNERQSMKEAKAVGEQFITAWLRAAGFVIEP